MEYTKIEGHPHLIRDSRTKAIMNTNQTEYNSYIAASRLKQQESKRVESIEHDLGVIKGEIDQVKQLLQELLNASR